MVDTDHIVLEKDGEIARVWLNRPHKLNAVTTELLHRLDEIIVEVDNDPNLKVLVLRGIHDTQCGFKLFSARAVQVLFPLQRLDGFGFDVEILFLARRAGLVIREIPITWVYGRESKVNVTSGARAFLDLLAVRWHQLRGAYPSRAEMTAAIERQSFL